MSRAEKKARKIRIQAAKLAVEQFMYGDGTTAAHVFAAAIMWENYIRIGADRTQDLMKILPEEKATVLRMVPAVEKE